MDFLMEFYFRGLTGKQTQKAYDFATKEFKAEINAMHVEQYKLEVFFSKYRLVMWLRLGEAGSAGLRKKLAGAVGVLLRKFAESLPEVWARVNGMATLTDNGFLPVQFGTMQSKPVTRVGTAHIPLRNAHHYWREMGKRKVLVDNGQREKEIRAMLSQAAAQAGGEVVSSPIMNDVVMTAERPVLNVITVDEKYINLPETLLTIILDRNLCFAIRSPEGRLLSTVRISATQPAGARAWLQIWPERKKNSLLIWASPSHCVSNGSGICSARAGWAVCGKSKCACKKLPWPLQSTLKRGKMFALWPGRLRNWPSWT